LFDRIVRDACVTDETDKSHRTRYMAPMAGTTCGPLVF